MFHKQHPPQDNSDPDRCTFLRQTHPRVHNQEPDNNGCPDNRYGILYYHKALFGNNYKREPSDIVQQSRTQVNHSLHDTDLGNTLDSCCNPNPTYNASQNKMSSTFVPMHPHASCINPTPRACKLLYFPQFESRLCPSAPIVKSNYIPDAVSLTLPLYIHTRIPHNITSCIVSFARCLFIAYVKPNNAATLKTPIKTNTPSISIMLRPFCFFFMCPSFFWLYLP